ncbi:hypothetical protein D9615_004267 [Tricholomella constricta]|uniref:MARVEL domain-containing protein n=1 Tax=Tricholomella constricta TaxID=117010 RepID=A0A8H5HFB7_9AGAR|nr:hypothetical protein D9615_004267 [Tricholomella constricta]
MTFISVFRIVALSLSLFCGLVVLGLTAHWTQGTLAGRLLYDFEIVALIAGAFTALVLPMMLVLGLIRRGAFTSMIVVELSALTVLWVLYLVVGALTAQWSNIFYPFGCSDLLRGAGWCREFFAIEGFSFIAWITLFLYTLTLLVYSLISQSRGNNVWRSAVSETTFFTPPSQAFPQAAPIFVSPAVYVPAPVQQYPPGSGPMTQASPAMAMHNQQFTVDYTGNALPQV